MLSNYFLLPAHETSQARNKVQSTFGVDEMLEGSVFGCCHATTILDCFSVFSTSTNKRVHQICRYISYRGRK